MHRGWLEPIRVALPVLLLLAGLSSLTLFGVVGLFRGELPWQLDLSTLYGSGWKLRHGIVPYGEPSTPPAVAADGIVVWLYAYPPSFAPLAIGLSALGWTTAKLVAVVLNILGTLGLAVMSARLMEPGRSSGVLSLSARQVAVVGIVLASPFVSHVVWLGNTTVLVTVALLLAWLANDTGRPVVAGLLLALVAIKPQFALLPGIWLLMERRWVVIGSAAAGSLALSAYAMIVYGPVQAFVDWIGGLLTYLSGGENAPGCLYCFGIGDLLVAGNLPATHIEMAALLSTVLLWFIRDRFTRLEILGLLMAMTAFFLPVHNYDLVILAPLVGAIAVWSATSVTRTAWALAAAVVIFIPLRFVQMVGSPLLLRWRELLLIVLIACLVAAALKRSPETASVTDATGGSN